MPGFVLLKLYYLCIVSNNFGSAMIFCGRLGYIQIYPSQDCDHGNLRYLIAIFSKTFFLSKLEIIQGMSHADFFEV